MKKTYAAFIICIIATILSVSCKKDDTLRYGNVTMGNLVDGKFISDQGNTFNMVEMNATVDLKKFRRGIMRCDVLREVGENEYDVRVTYMDTVLTKKPVAASVALTDPEKVVEDPIHIEQLWVAGGYINMYVVFEIQVNPFLKDSKHMVNLILDDTAKENGTYTFTLRHNAFGATFAKANEDEKDKEGDDQVEIAPLAENSVSWGFAGSYVSFPIADLISEKSSEITLKWKSHVITGNSWSSSVEDKTYKFTYSKDYFEHAPLNIKSKVAAQVR